MHIFFDQQIFVAQEQGGISRYFIELARALAESGSQVRLFGGMTRNTYLCELQRTAGLDPRFVRRKDRLRINTWIARVSRLGARWDFAQLRRHSSRLVYHATNYALDPWIARRADATCLTVFDMIGELLCDEPSRVRSIASKRRSLRLADGVLCISQQTKRDFALFFPEWADRARVTLLAASLTAPGPGELARASGLAPYLLLVGKRAGYKNGQTALRAFSALAPEYKTLRLVCIGGEAFSPEEESLVREQGVRDRVVVIRGSDALLAAFYTQSAALLYPSRYEGFGLPVLEALQFGCPVLTTACASLPEVGGEAVVYLNPDDVPAWIAAGTRLLQDEKWRQHWVTAGKSRAAQFSWRNTAAQTRTAYDEVYDLRRAETRAGLPPSVRACSGAKRS